MIYDILLKLPRSSISDVYKVTLIQLSFTSQGSVYFDLTECRHLLNSFFKEQKCLCRVRKRNSLSYKFPSGFLKLSPSCFQGIFSLQQTMTAARNSKFTAHAKNLFRGQTASYFAYHQSAKNTNQNEDTKWDGDVSRCNVPSPI